MKIADLISFLEREKYEERFALIQNYHRHVLERIENHMCIDQCRVVETNQSGVVLHCEENHARFREGDSVILNPLNKVGGGLEDGYEMEWISFDPVRNLILLEKGFRTRNRAFPFEIGSLVQVDTVGNDLHDSTRAMMEWARDASAGERIDQWLDGKLPILDAPVRNDLRDRIVQVLSLTPSQVSAFDEVISRYPVSAVQGPPGTGKTWLVSAIASYYLAQGRDVLITAVSHFAINNALNAVARALAKSGIVAEVIKVSRNKNTGLDSGVKIMAHLESAGKNPDAGALVAGMTPFKFRFELKNRSFPVMIMDEASQANLTYMVFAMVYARKIILVGDQMQMQPIINGSHSPQLMQSAFEHHLGVYSPGAPMLTETFRMNKELLAFPCARFYGGRLEAMPSCRERRLRSKALPGGILGKLLDPLIPGTLGIFDHKDATKTCQSEAIAAGALALSAIVAMGVEPSQVAILVPFRAQQVLIRRIIKRYENLNRLDLGELIVDTVERMQGQERELVIFSMTASDLDRLNALGSDYFDLGKLNVALSRASSKRIVLASPRMLLVRSMDPGVLRAIDAYADFFEIEPSLRVGEVELKEMKDFLELVQT